MTVNENTTERPKKYEQVWKRTLNPSKPTNYISLNTKYVNLDFVKPFL